MHKNESTRKSVELLILLILTLTILVSCASSEVNIDVSYDSEQGKVEGQGVYKKDDRVSLVAKSNKGYRFSHWEENGQKVGSTSPTVSFHVTENREFKAVFKKLPKHPVTVTSSNKDYGVVNNLNENLAEDKKITLKATPEDGCDFEGWFLNGKKISSKKI
ncbi:MAG: InlB B-repeat-containing protein [Bacillota bacterium]